MPRALLVLSLYILVLWGMLVDASTKLGASKASLRYNAKATPKSKPLTGAAKETPKGARRVKQKPRLIEHPKPLRPDGPLSIGRADKALALPEDEPIAAKKPSSVGRRSSKHALASDVEQDDLSHAVPSRMPRSPSPEPRRRYHIPDSAPSRRIRRGRRASRDNLEVRTDDYHLIDNSERIDSDVESMGRRDDGPVRYIDEHALQGWLDVSYGYQPTDVSNQDDQDVEKTMPKFEASGPYFVNELFKLMPEEQVELFDRKSGGPQPKVVELQSPEEFGVKAAVSLGPREHTVSSNLMPSGDRIITARYSASLTAEMQYENKIEVYDLMTNAVLFSVKHISSNSRLTLHASNRLLVVLENSHQEERHRRHLTNVTVYERIDDRSIEASTILYPERIDTVKFLDAGSKIALCGKFATVFLKGKGFFKLPAAHATFSERWLIYHSSFRNERDINKLIAVDTHTGTTKCLLNYWNRSVVLSGDILIWTETHRSMHVLNMIDLNQADLTPQKIGAMPRHLFRRPEKSFVIDSFAKLRLVAIIDRRSVGLLNVDLGTFAVVHSSGELYRDITVRHDSPLILQGASCYNGDRASIIHLKGSSMPDYENFSVRASACEVLRKKTAKVILTHLLGYVPAPTRFTRWIKMPLTEESFYAFDDSLKYRYEMGSDFVIHRQLIHSDDAKRLVARLPKSHIKGAPLHLEINFNGTAFYLTTKDRNEQYIYVIDAENRNISGYRLEDLKSSIARIKAHAAGKILTVTLRDKRTLIFSCKDNRQLRLLSTLQIYQELLSVNQFVAVFREEWGFGEAKIGFINLAEKGSEPVSFPNQDVEFIALDGSDVFLQIPHLDLIVRFNVQSKKKAIVNDHQSKLASSVLFSQKPNGNIIHIIDRQSVYRVIDATTFRQLYSTPLPFPHRRDKSLQIAVSSNGRRVLFGWRGMIDIFEIFDPAFPHGLQPLGEAAKPVKQPILFNAAGVRMDRSSEQRNRYVA